MLIGCFHSGVVPKFSSLTANIEIVQQARLNRLGKVG